MRVYMAWLFGALMWIAWLMCTPAMKARIEVVHKGSDMVDATAPSILSTPTSSPQVIMAFGCLNKRAQPPPPKGEIWADCEPQTRPLRRLLLAQRVCSAGLRAGCRRTVVCDYMAKAKPSPSPPPLLTARPQHAKAQPVSWLSGP